MSLWAARKIRQIFSAEDYVADIFANFELLDNDYKNVVENLIIQLLDIQKKNQQTQTNKK